MMDQDMDGQGSKDNFIDVLRQELGAADPPRPVALRSFGSSWQQWFDYLTPLLLVMLFGIFSIPQIVQELASNYGVPATGQITGWHTSHSKSGTHYHVSVRFTNEKQETCSGSMEVYRNLYQSAPIGSPVDIHYLPQFPNWPSLDCDHPPVLPGIIIVSIISVVMIVAVLYNFYREYKVFQKGTFVKGKVTSATFGRYSRTTVSYSWNDKELTLDQSGHLGEVGDPAAVLKVPEGMSQFFLGNGHSIFQVQSP